MAARVSSMTSRSRTRTFAGWRLVTTRMNARSPHRCATTSASSTASHIACQSSGPLAKVSSRSASVEQGPADASAPIRHPKKRHLGPDVADAELLLIRPIHGFPAHLEGCAAERVEVSWTVLALGTDGVTEP